MAQQGSAGGRGPGGKPPGGSQGGSAGSSPSRINTSTTGGTPTQQGTAGGMGRSGPSPAYTETTGGQRLSQSDAPFRTDSSDTAAGTTGGPTTRKGCGCCGGAVMLLAVIGIVFVLSFFF